MRGICSLLLSIVTATGLTGTMQCQTSAIAASSYAPVNVLAGGLLFADDEKSSIPGTHRSGQLDALSSLDGRRYEVDSTFIREVGHMAAIGAAFVIKEAPASITSLDFAFDVQASNEWGRSAQFFGYNWSLEKYEYIEIVYVGRKHKGEPVGEVNENASRFVNSQGVIKIVVRVGAFSCTRALTSPEPFTMKIDILRLRVRTQTD